jgi:hypothetical protein
MFFFIKTGGIAPTDYIKKLRISLYKASQLQLRNIKRKERFSKIQYIA